MHLTYSALLRDNHLEWTGDAPPPVVVPGQALRVQVTLLEPESAAMSEEVRRAALLSALESIASRGGVQSIPDPAGWQREMREDRNLPGR